MSEDRDWVEDAKALLEMGAVMVDASTVRGLLERIADLEHALESALDHCEAESDND